MANAFDIPTSSSIGKELQETQAHRVRMTKWVESQRRKNIDPGRLDINKNPKRPKDVTTEGIK